MFIFIIEGIGDRKNDPFVMIASAIHQFLTALDYFISWRYKTIRVLGPPLPTHWEQLLFNRAKEWKLFPQIRELRGVTIVNFSIA
jgi:hypothetical protein